MRSGSIEAMETAAFQSKSVISVKEGRGISNSGGQGGEDLIQNSVQLLADIRRQEPEDKKTVPLKDRVLPAVPPPGFLIGVVLWAINFDHKPRVCAQKISLQTSLLIERDR